MTDAPTTETTLEKPSKERLALFREKAELVSAVVTELKSLTQATKYVVDLCEKKGACEILVSGCAEKLSEKAEQLCGFKTGKLVAAPNLGTLGETGEKTYKKLEAACNKQNILCVKDGLREHLGGLDIGFTVCDAGIADTGTLVLDSNAEETRIATMMAEIHVAAVRTSDIVQTLFDIEEAFGPMLAKQPSYTAFITGASRTADIERVLALGVHGPLELHILLLEDW